MKTTIKVMTDAELGAYLLDIQRTVAKIELMTALDNLKMALRKAKEAVMNTCSGCEKDFLIEDLYSCDKCGKNFCPDCIVNIGNNTDDLRQVCKSCMKGGDF